MVDSVETLRKAIYKSRSMSSKEVFKDRDDFIYEFEKRLIYGAFDSHILRDMGKNYDYGMGIRSLGKALKIVCDKK